MIKDTLSVFSSLFLVFVCERTWTWPLDSVLIRGDSSVNITWIPDSINTDPTWYIQNGSLCTGSDTVYLHSDFIPGRTYHGIAFSYGGEDLWDVFGQRIDSGYPAGSHLCHYRTFGDPSPAIAGTDCSGFLCNIWNVPRMSTSGLAQSPRFEKIDKSQLRVGDALVRAGYHCVFVVESEDLTETVIWEASSSVFGCRERITDITESYWEPYIALRNPEISGIPINHSPFGKPVSSYLSLFIGPNNTIVITWRYFQAATVIMYTSQGRIIGKARIPAYSQRITIELPRPLAKGIYLFVICTNNARIIARPIVHTGL